MTTGVLIYAFNNEHIDYLAMAAWTTKNIHRHLKLPVCVVTDCTDIPAHYQFDCVVNSTPVGNNIRVFEDFGGISKGAHWYNTNRVDAYASTPWETTLVLDADYVVASNQLLTLLEVDQDFLAHKTAYDVTNGNTFLTGVNDFGAHNMPMWWATVMLFKKSITAELIFDSMLMIKENWKHYCSLYHNTRSTYRNDHALSIALNLVNGHTLDHPGIPWDLATLMPGPKLEQIHQDRYRVEYTTPQKQQRYIILDGQDFHAMGKFQLGDIVASNI